MPSSRRIKLIAVGALTTLLLILYLRSSTYPTTRQSRYLQALVDISDRERLTKQQQESLVPPADHSQDLSDSAGVAERLKEAEGAAKKAAMEKAGPRPDPPRVVEGSRKAKEGGVGEKVLGDGEGEGGVYDAGVEIEGYLKRAPVVIFSKSYCPYSKRAKTLLLDKYNIVPAPLVVELDQHAHGAEIQAALGKRTGRRTVPNVLVAGESIGGCDDVYAMEEEGRLHDRIKALGGARVRSIARLKE